MTIPAARVDGNERMVERGEQLFRERYEANLIRTDRLFAYLLVGQWLFGIVIALWFSPYGWEGKTRSLHVHVPLAVFLGGAISAYPLLLIVKRPGAAITRHSIAVAQMLWSGLLIHLTGGRIETHFHIFGSLAFLSFYRDWKVLVPATLLVVLDHLVRQLWYPESVYGVMSPETWRFLEHGFWVAFEDVFLVIACVTGVREMRSIAAQQAHIELTEQLEQEMKIAAQIETAILPPEPIVNGLEIAASMVPASEVGGDYYDVLPVDGDGCWIGIGDVAGHGLAAGLLMLQAQSAIKALVVQQPDRSPRELLVDVNCVLYDNVRHRLGHNEHMTLTLIRYHLNGQITVAGAHQTLVICRGTTGRCERHATLGTWLGLVADVRPHMKENSYQLQRDDLLILFTDGLTEAMSERDEQFGLDRLCTEIESMRKSPVAQIQRHVLEKVSQWSGNQQDDDRTLLIVRHAGNVVQPSPAPFVAAPNADAPIAGVTADRA